MTRLGLRRSLLACLCLTLAACKHSPSFNLVGSYFPAWMVCLPFSILLTISIRVLVLRLGLKDYVRPAFLSYFGLWAFFTFGLWLLFFS